MLWHSLGQSWLRKLKHWSTLHTPPQHTYYGPQKWENRTGSILSKCSDIHVLCQSWKKKNSQILTCAHVYRQQKVWFFHLSTLFTLSPLQSSSVLQFVLYWQCSPTHPSSHTHLLPSTIPWSPQTLVFIIFVCRFHLFHLCLCLLLIIDQSEVSTRPDILSWKRSPNQLFLTWTCTSFPTLWPAFAIACSSRCTSHLLRINNPKMFYSKKSI